MSRSSSARNRSLRAAATASGVVALASLPASVLLTGDVAKTAVYATAFVAASAAIVPAAVAHLRARDERPTVAPGTRTGRWSVGLTTAGIALLLVAPVLASVLHGNSTEPVLLVGAPGLLGVGALIAAAVTALVAWFRRGERSVLVLLGVVPGLLALFLLIGEFVFPHQRHAGSDGHRAPESAIVPVRMPSGTRRRGPPA